VPVSKIKGFFDPRLPAAQTAQAEGQGGTAYNSLPAGDKKIAEQLAEYDYDPTRLSMRSGKNATNTKKIYEAAYELNPKYSMGDYANNKAYKATWNKATAP